MDSPEITEKTKATAIGFRVRVSLKEYLEKRAKAEKRTLSNSIELILMEVMRNDKNDYDK